jgi:hypothetical protein
VNPWFEIGMPLISLVWEDGYNGRLRRESAILLMRNWLDRDGDKLRGRENLRRRKRAREGYMFRRGRRKS